MKVRIEDASDKDVVEVVRCMDCVNGCPQTLPDGRKVVVCTNVFAFADVGHEPDFYCKEGENK